MHERQAIRDEIVARLIAADTAAEGRVVKSRSSPLKLDQLPMISVYNEIEPIREGSEKGSDGLERLFEVTIVGWTHASSDSDVDDDLDDLALEIEAAIDADPTLDRNSSSAHLVNTQFGIDMKGERPMGAVSLTYLCRYFTDTRNAAPTDIFDTAHAQVDLGGEQAADDQSEALVEDINEPG